MGETLYIVIPVYNEEANIEHVISEWYPILKYGDENSRIVISDGGSKDRTLQILYKLKKAYPNLVVILKPETDHGTKVIALYKYAIKKHADWIFQTDSDGQTLPEEFSGFWKLRNKYDVILGNRKIRGDGLVRKFVEIVLRIYIKVFFGIMVPDANAPFRLMKSSVVNKYIWLMPDNFNLPNAILSACFSRYHEKIIYRIVTFKPRRGGKNHMNIKSIIKIGGESVKNFMQIKRRLKKYEKEQLLSIDIGN